MIGAGCFFDGSFMVDMSESDFSTDEFRALLGFVNTVAHGQKRGYRGNAKQMDEEQHGKHHLVA